MAKSKARLRVVTSITVPKIIRELGGGWRIEEWFAIMMRQGEEAEQDPCPYSFHRDKAVAHAIARKTVNGKIVWGYAKIVPVHMLVHNSKPIQGTPFIECKPFKDGERAHDKYEGAFSPSWDDNEGEETMK